MDDVVNRFARELADSIAAAVSGSAEVEACRERARAAGDLLRPRVVLGHRQRIGDAAVVDDEDFFLADNIIGEMSNAPTLGHYFFRGVFKSFISFFFGFFSFPISLHLLIEFIKWNEMRKQKR